MMGGSDDGGEGLMVAGNGGDGGDDSGDDGNDGTDGTGNNIGKGK